MLRGKARLNEVEFTNGRKEEINGSYEILLEVFLAFAPSHCTLGLRKGNTFMHGFEVSSESSKEVLS